MMTSGPSAAEATVSATATSTDPHEHPAPDAAEAPLSARELQANIDAAPMSGAQVKAVAITAVLSMLDGYDVLSVSFAAPALAAAWHIGKAALGGVLSSGLVGMAFGSLLLAPLADIWGRRALVVAALCILIAGGGWSALSATAAAMVGSRILTGLGLGVLVAVLTPLAAEFANARRRALAVSAMAMGYPFGGVVGGLLAAALLHSIGWQAVFVAKSLAALALLPIVLLWLPESPAYLMGLRSRDAIRRLSAYLVRCGHRPVRELTAEAAPTAKGYGALFAPAQRTTTLRMIVVNALYTMTAYYLVSWLPQMVADAGYAPSTSSLISAITNLCGVLGGLLLGFTARWVQLRGLVVATVLALASAMALFGFAPKDLPVLASAAACCGFFLFAGVSGVYAIIATSFAPEARGSGVGLVMGVGRITSATAPYLAGWMFAAGTGRSVVSAAFAGLAVIAALALAAPFGRR